MKLSADDLLYLSDCAISATIEAGHLIASRAAGPQAVQHKEGGESLASQVLTEVDLLSEATIVKQLQPTCEQYGFALLTEETTDDKARLDSDYFWCVDPLDGTLSFIESVPGYAVSIALVSRSGIPLIGVVYDPLSQTLYSAVKGQGVLRNGEAWSLSSDSFLGGKPLTLVCDRSLVERSDYPQVIQHFEIIASKLGLQGVQTLHNGGAVMNACWVLENQPACYFKFPKPEEGGGSLWDVAATACLFHEMGAFASDYYGQPLELNRPESTFMNHRGVLFVTERGMANEIRMSGF